MFSNPFFQNYNKTDASLEIIIMLAVAALLGLLLGWLLFNRNKIIASLNEEIANLKIRLNAAETNLGEAKAGLEKASHDNLTLHADLDSCSDSKSKLYMKLAELEALNTSLRADLDVSRAAMPEMELSAASNMVAPVSEQHIEEIPELIIEETPAPVVEFPIAEIEPETPEVVINEPIEEVAPPVVMAVSKSSKGDNLKIIEGIGPVIERLLKNAGIKTFAELADTTPERIREILLAEGEHYRIHDPGTWPQQSALARDGKMDELKELQDNLKGGR